MQGMRTVAGVWTPPCFGGVCPMTARCFPVGHGCQIRCQAAVQRDAAGWRWKNLPASDGRRCDGTGLGACSSAPPCQRFSCSRSVPSPGQGFHIWLSNHTELAMGTCDRQGSACPGMDLLQESSCLALGLQLRRVQQVQQQVQAPLQADRVAQHFGHVPPHRGHPPGFLHQLEDLGDGLPQLHRAGCLLGAGDGPVQGGQDPVQGCSHIHVDPGGDLPVLPGAAPPGPAPRLAHALGHHQPLRTRHGEEPAKLIEGDEQGTDRGKGRQLAVKDGKQGDLSGPVPQERLGTEPSGFRVPGRSHPPARTVAGGLRSRPPRMRLLVPALLLALLATARAAEDSCEGRCDDAFDARRKCQCDTLCVYYQSCCSDYSTVCKAKVTRGDVFALPEDDYLDYNLPVYFSTVGDTEAPPTEVPPSLLTVQPTLETEPDPEETLTEVPVEVVPSTTPDGAGERDPVEEPEELCSRKPFDAFTDLKNGSLYAFRGKYFYELDKTSVRPGYPKLISDVWGIEGPIDAAFTRINCQGKTYLFKGSQYWRFDDGVLDPGYPRDISEGFEGIPNNIDAAFALPAHSYHGNERVYFFKDKLYWSYDFAHQPTQADCEKSSPSAVFNHYAFMNRDSWEDVFQILFGSRMTGASSPRYISKDWRGVPSRLDAAMAGRIYVASQQPRRRKSRRQRKRYKSHRSLNLGFWRWLQNDSESAGIESDWLSGSQCKTLQSVYFFVGDKYYRVNLQTKRVDLVQPRYPRSIAQYWLDCPQPGEEST